MDLPGRHHERHRPLPQGVAARNTLFTGHKVRAFLYSQQVTDALAASFIALAKASGIPVVGVCETMPAATTTSPR